ncbi:hypothetical protein [Enhygromyxa salina]|uniref:hypothetical protein n=1 Tax=Enhygromyxa salina TaxID=215803 RepID=UPI000D03B616|nr:hypothetical protein [Enhygromyxa salina]
MVVVGIIGVVAAATGWIIWVAAQRELWVWAVIAPAFSGGFISQWLRCRPHGIRGLDTLASTVAVGLTLLAIALGRE